MAMTKTQVEDDETFMAYDVPEMSRSYKSPVVTHSMKGTPTLSRARSTPTMVPKPAPARLSQPPDRVSKLEDEHYTYFVPGNRATEVHTNGHTLSRLRKDDTHRVSFPFTAEGTGFRTQACMTAQGQACEWWPTQDRSTSHHYGNMSTSYRDGFKKPGHFRKSPLSNSGMLALH